MRTLPRLGLLAVLSAFAVSAGFARNPAPTKADSHAQSSTDEAAGYDRSLTADDRLSLIAAALDSRDRNNETDCSHLVHAIYEQAGFTYAYAPSSELYAGVGGFQRIKKPEAGDLVVWRGHAGIVIKPSQHIFFSVLSTGPGIDDYTTPYWKHRGKPRFYRYVKSSLSIRQSPQLMRTNRLRKSPPSDTDADQ